MSDLIICDEIENDGNYTLEIYVTLVNTRIIFSEFYKEILNNDVKNNLSYSLSISEQVKKLGEGKARFTTNPKTINLAFQYFFRY